MRHSATELGPVYFLTATVNSWNKLLSEDRYKDEIIASLRLLSERGKIQVFAFVIMPNHIHLIWRLLERNGKESPQGSMLKFTAHRFKQMLLDEHGADALIPYDIKRHNKAYEFWQRDSLAVILISKPVALQKLNYIHNNLLTERWQVAANAAEYKYSSAHYYQTGIDNFGFLHNLHDEFLGMFPEA
ncbi:MAG: transposase [Chitinophagaceae bacterium]